jgi:hypothetical protein
MQKYVNDIATVVGGSLAPLASASCAVYLTGTTTLASLYSDNGVTALTNPTTSSATGRLQFYAADGRYDIVCSKTGFTTTTITDVLLEDPAQGQDLYYLPAGTGAVSRTVQGKLRESVSVTDFGAVGDGVTDDRAAIVAAVAAANGVTILFPAGAYLVGSSLAVADGTHFYMQAGATFITNQPTGASIYYETNQATGTAGSVMKVQNLFEASAFPLKNEGAIWSAGTYTYLGVSKEMTASTTTGQGSGSLTGGPLAGFFAFTQNNGAAGDVVALIADSVARTSNGSVFGANIIVRNAAGTSNTKLTGLEIDYEPSSGTTDNTSSAGLVMNVFSISSNAPIALIGRVSGGSWANGFITSGVRGAHYSVLTGDTQTAVSFIDTGNGTFSSNAIKLGTGASQAINFGGAVFGTSPLLYGTAGGDLTANMGTSGFVVFLNPAGAQRFTFDQYGVINMPNNGAIKINSTQVVQQRETGYTAMTGTSDKATAYATSTVTLAQLAGRVMALQTSLTTHGLIGA